MVTIHEALLDFSNFSAQLFCKEHILLLEETMGSKMSRSSARGDGCWEAKEWPLAFDHLILSNSKSTVINEYPDFVHSLMEHAGCMDDLLVG